MIWPGFVDAVTTLLMVLMFVLTIFTVMQSVLRDTITTQTTELDRLTAQVADLADALGLERQKVGDLQDQMGTLTATLADAQAKGEAQAALIATLTGQLSARRTSWRRRRAGSPVSRRRWRRCCQNATRRGAGGALTAKVADLEAAEQADLGERGAATGAGQGARRDRRGGRGRAAGCGQARGAGGADRRSAETRARRDCGGPDGGADAQISEAEAARLVDAAALAGAARQAEGLGCRTDRDDAGAGGTAQAGGRNADPAGGGADRCGQGGDGRGRARRRCWRRQRRP